MHLIPQEQRSLGRNVREWRLDAAIQGPTKQSLSFLSNISLTRDWMYVCSRNYMGYGDIVKTPNGRK